MTKEIRYTEPWKLALFLIVWMLITGGLIYLGATRSYDDYQFTHHGVAISGTLVQKYYTVSQGKNGPQYTYRISFNYTVGNLRGFCDQTVLEITYDDFGGDGHVPLIYLPNNPRKVRLDSLAEEHDFQIHTWGICFFAALFLAVGLYGFGMTFRANAIYQRLQREGQLCRARVTGVSCEYVGKSRTPRYYLNLQYRDMMGGDLWGRGVYLPRDEEGRWREGNTIDLRYDRAKPQRFILDYGSR